MSDISSPAPVKSAARGDTTAVERGATVEPTTDGDAIVAKPSTKPPKKPFKKMPSWMDARFVADASRTSVLLIILIVVASLNAPTLASPRSASESSLLRDSIMWTGVTIAVASMSRVGATARRCVERVAGTLAGGAIGLAAAVAVRPAVTALGAVVASMAGEAFGRGGACDTAGKLTLATFCIMALPSLLDTPANPSDDVRATTAKIAAARLGAIVVGVCLVAVASVVWFPR